MTRKRFANLEDRLQRLIEGGFAQLFGGPLEPRDVALQIVRAIEDHCLNDDDGNEIAPNRYHIALHPQDHAALLAKTPDLVRQLAEQVRGYCQEAGLLLQSYPRVALLDDSQVTRRQVRIEVHHATRATQATQTLDQLGQSLPQPRPTLEAQLVFDNNRTVSIQRPVFNIGRRPDNDLVIEDPLVSRHHVQLQLRQGKHVLFDTGSKSGTTVNGQPVREHVLRSGDVIQIGSTALFYLIEEQAAPLGDTNMDMSPPGVEGA